MLAIHLKKGLLMVTCGVNNFWSTIIISRLPDLPLTDTSDSMSRAPDNWCTV